MRLVLIGATGGTGLHVIDQAIDRGHHVVAYCRRPDALKPRPGLTVAGGSKGVGTAVNETLVLCVIALFAVNVVLTTIGIKFGTQAG